MEKGFVRRWKAEKCLFVTGIFLIAAVWLLILPQMASAQDNSDGAAAMTEEKNVSLLTSGLSGIIKSIKYYPDGDMPSFHMGTSADTVLIGQRIRRSCKEVLSLDAASYLRQDLFRFQSLLEKAVGDAYLLSDYDYDNLCHIVEAEAGTEDIKGKILVANVILNRVRSNAFPDSVSDVIYQYENGVAQFSPVEDGRIYTVTISGDTVSAVKQALEGVDYSQGALFFIEKAIADSHSILWFDSNLTYLFKHGVHEFYTFPNH
ncbi:MAG: cell wall hydrolase [Blautia sp.]|nr:cell wall hydrolase [Blautia sp.]